MRVQYGWLLLGVACYLLGGVVFLAAVVAPAGGGLRALTADVLVWLLLSAALFGLGGYATWRGSRDGLTTSSGGLPPRW